MVNYDFSNRMGSIKPSAIREILKTTQSTDVISFAAGSPAPEAFPIKEIENITQLIFSDKPYIALNYSISEGYPPLCKTAADFVKLSEGDIITEDDDLVVVSGGQQGIDLTAKCFVNEGDTVLVEEPTFASAINTFRTYGANVVGVPMEPDGPSIAVLEEKLKTEKNIKIFYVIPNFQNPTGYTMSLEKRRKVYELCTANGVIILEDNPYGCLRFGSEQLPSIKSMDTDGSVIYVGSFSKIVSPGMRVGFVIANKKALSPMVVGKQCSDVHSNILAQMICERFLSTINVQAYINGLQKIYRSKKTLMLANLAEHCGDKVKFSDPQGGLFIWATMPEGSDAMDFCKKASENGVAVVPGNPFFTDEGALCNTFRINFSTPSNDKIVEGCEKLGQVIKEYFK